MKLAIYIGLACNMAGVILLFRYGMPYRVETGGLIGLAAEQEDQEAKKWEPVYKKLGYLGLALVIIGTALQAYGTYLS